MGLSFKNCAVFRFGREVKKEKVSFRRSALRAIAVLSWIYIGFTFLWGYLQEYTVKDPSYNLKAPLYGLIAFGLFAVTYYLVVWIGSFFLSLPRNKDGSLDLRNRTNRAVMGLGSLDSDFKFNKTSLGILGVALLFYFLWLVPTLTEFTFTWLSDLGKNFVKPANGFAPTLLGQVVLVLVAIGLILRYLLVIKPRYEHQIMQFTEGAKPKDLATALKFLQSIYEEGSSEFGRAAALRKLVQQSDMAPHDKASFRRAYWIFRLSDFSDTGTISNNLQAFCLRRLLERRKATGVGSIDEYFGRMDSFLRELSARSFTFFHIRRSISLIRWFLTGTSVLMYLLLSSMLLGPIFAALGSGTFPSNQGGSLIIFAIVSIPTWGILANLFFTNGVIENRVDLKWWDRCVEMWFELIYVLVWPVLLLDRLVRKVFR